MNSKKIYKVLLHNKVKKEIKGLPKRIREKIITLIDSLAMDPIPQNSKKLQGRNNSFRIRVGNYRLVYEVHATEIVVYVVAVGHRKEIYRYLVGRVK